MAEPEEPARNPDVDKRLRNLSKQFGQGGSGADSTLAGNKKRPYQDYSRGGAPVDPPEGYERDPDTGDYVKKK